jgi:hypothetical protein
MMGRDFRREVPMPRLVHFSPFGDGHGAEENSRFWGTALDGSGVGVVKASVSESRIELQAVNSKGDAVYERILAGQPQEKRRP